MSALPQKRDFPLLSQSDRCIRFITEYLDRVTNKAFPQMSRQDLEQLCLQHDPIHVSLEEWVAYLVKKTNVQIALAALIYIRRALLPNLEHVNEIQPAEELTIYNRHRVYFVCLIVATKFLADVSFSLKDWCSIGLNCWTVNQLHQMEKILLDKMKWKLMISTEEFSQYINLAEEMVPRRNSNDIRSSSSQRRTHRQLLASQSSDNLSPRGSEARFENMMLNDEGAASPASDSTSNAIPSDASSSTAPTNMNADNHLSGSHVTGYLSAQTVSLSNSTSAIPLRPRTSNSIQSHTLTHMQSHSHHTAANNPGSSSSSSATSASQPLCISIPNSSTSSPMSQYVPSPHSDLHSPSTPTGSATPSSYSNISLITSNRSHGSSSSSRGNINQGVGYTNPDRLQTILLTHAQAKLQRLKLARSTSESCVTSHSHAMSHQIMTSPLSPGCTPRTGNTPHTGSPIAQQQTSSPYPSSSHHTPTHHHHTSMSQSQSRSRSLKPTLSSSSSSSSVTAFNGTPSYSLSPTLTPRNSIGNINHVLGLSPSSSSSPSHTRATNTASTASPTSGTSPSHSNHNNSSSSNAGNGLTSGATNATATATAPVTVTGTSTPTSARARISSSASPPSPTHTPARVLQSKTFLSKLKMKSRSISTMF